VTEYIEITPELLAGFLDEARQYIETLNNDLMAFEAEVSDGQVTLQTEEQVERMNEMFRAAHSLKGLSATMGFQKVNELTHRLESFFDAVRTGRRPLDVGCFDILYRVVDNLEELIRGIEDGSEAGIPIDDSLRLLDSLLNEEGETTQVCKVEVTSMSDQKEQTHIQHTESEPSGGHVPASQQAGSDAAQAFGRDNSEESEASVALPSAVLDDPSLRELFFDSTFEALDSLNEQLLALEKQPDSDEVLNETFRLAHTIKGSVGSAGLVDLSAMAHEMESVLEKLRSRQDRLNDALANALFKGADWIRQRLNDLKSGTYQPLSDEEARRLFAAWIGEPVNAAERPKTGQASDAARQTEAAKPSHPATTGDSGERVFTLDVVFKEDNAESDIQAYLIYNKLKDAAEVLSCDPDMESLEAGQNIRTLRMTICGSISPQDVENLVSKFDVESIKVTPADGGPQPEQKERNPVRESTADPDDAPSAGQSARSSDPATAGTSAGASGQTSKPAAANVPGKAPASAARSAAQRPTAQAPGQVKAGGTLRVDVERLDQLMNLGGELVINRARFARLHDRLRQIFENHDIRSTLQELSSRLQDLAAMAESEDLDPSELGELTQTLMQHLREIQDLAADLQESKVLMNQFGEAVHALERISDGIQKRIMETRMVPVGPLFSRFRRVVRDLAKARGKQIELVLRGENTELDKKMIDELGDPLTHLIRNAADHGIEMPDERAAAGKPPTGTIVLEAYHRGHNICIEVRDDGKGIDPEAIRQKVLEKGLASPAQLEQMSYRELIQFIFHPGLSTAKQVTDVSGRGMGMDIVKTKIEALNGTIEVDSEPGRGTKITLKLPLTLAILPSLLVRIGSVTYAIPLDAVNEIIEVSSGKINRVHGKRVTKVRDRLVPVVCLEDFFGRLDADLATRSVDSDNLTLVILGAGEQIVGLVVDELIGEEDVVIKSLAENYRSVKGFTGASIMGDGSVSLILDVGALLGISAGERTGDARAA